ncbi:MAG: tail fiber domain-containing protein [Bacteroidetes bacterium]|nr:tail fiber domain-containing protein [Bacteroidota bacterium]
MKHIIYGLFILLCAGAVQAQIGFGTASPNSSLDVRGGLAVNLRSFTGNTSIASSDYTLIFTGTSAATATLPDATSCAGRVYWIKNASTAATTPVLTIATTASQTIDGIASWTLDEPNEAVRFMSNGTNWHVGNQGVPVLKTATTAGPWDEGGDAISTQKNIGTITAFDMGFVTNNSEKMRLSSAGLLGLGTSSPAGGIHFVNDNVSNGDSYYFDDYMNGTNTITAGIYLRKSGGTIASPANLQNGDLIAQFRFSGRYNGSLTRIDGSGVDAYYLGDGTTDTTDLRFFTSGDEAMRINQSGNVAIGTTTYNTGNAEKLVVDAGTTGSYNVISGKGDIDNYLQLNIQNRSNGTQASSDLVATANNGDESTNYIDLGINSNGYTNTSLPILGGINTCYLYTTGADFVIGNTTATQDLIFFTNGLGASNEKMRILDVGNVGIGTSTPADKLSIAGVLAPSSDNTYSIGTSTNRWSEVWATNGVIQTSDARFKTNIEPLEYGTKELMRLQPVSYRWKTAPRGARMPGLLAQQTRRVIPEVVTGDEAKQTLGMNYPEMVTVLINTIKEQQQRLQQLKQELEALQKNGN